MRYSGVTALIGMTVALPAMAQNRNGSSGAETTRDIIVNGELSMPANPQTVIVPPPSTGGYDIEAAVVFEDASRRAALCATRGGSGRLALLRRVVDGVFATPAQERAQDQLVWQTATCGEGSGIRNQGINSFGRVNVRADSAYCPGTLYRGAFIIEAIRAFAPDLSITREQLADPQVQQRFLMREDARASKRLPGDLRFFRTAICIVREQPELAIRLIQTNPVERSTAAVQAHLIERTRACTGYAKRLTVDPYQFRAFIGDALYRWALAVRDVPTLIPTQPQEQSPATKTLQPDNN